MNHIEEFNQYQDEQRLLVTPPPAVMGHVSHEELWTAHYNLTHRINDLDTNTRATIAKLTERLNRAERRTDDLERTLAALLGAALAFTDAASLIPALATVPNLPLRRIMQQEEKENA